MAGSQIVMDYHMAHADAVCPRDFRMSLTELGRYPPRGFAADLDQMREGKAQVLVLVVLGSVLATDLLERLSGRIQHVPHVDQVILRRIAARRRPRLDPESDR